ncbi:MAG: serine hydrolase [Bacteroidales bacterium]|jgi:CubicO group peptidase (beta-lactamase class C family)|nr:serine hydrolase [Bacteroidales bacterium]
MKIFIKSIYFKSLIIITTIIIIAVFSSAIRSNLFGANIKTKEALSNTINNELAQILYKNKINKIDSFMQVRTKRYGFNGNVLVSYKGNLLYNNSFGYSDPKHKEKLQTESIFQLASVSKQFTAMSIMILKEKGKLNYEDNIKKYLPTLPYDNITLRMLLNHTSGLPNYMWLVEHHWKKDTPPYNTDIIKLMSKYDLPLYFKSGTRFAYSNTGYILLASIVEEISKMEFHQFITKEIFFPLEMDNSFVYSAALKNKHTEKLTGYRHWGRSFRIIPETVNDGAVGDKGIYSTTEDLYKWDKALYFNLLISKETLKDAFSPLKINKKYTIPYGFGFRIRNNDTNNKIVYHHGRWNGFRTSFLRYMGDTSAIVILNNTSASGNTLITKKLRRILNNKIDSNYTQNLILDVLYDGSDIAISNFINNSEEDSYIDTNKINLVIDILNKYNKNKTSKEFNYIIDKYKKGELNPKQSSNLALLNNYIF